MLTETNLIQHFRNLKIATVLVLLQCSLLCFQSMVFLPEAHIMAEHADTMEHPAGEEPVTDSFPERDAEEKPEEVGEDPKILEPSGMEDLAGGQCLRRGEGPGYAKGDLRLHKIPTPPPEA